MKTKCIDWEGAWMCWKYILHSNCNKVQKVSEYQPHLYLFIQFPITVKYVCCFCFFKACAIFHQIASCLHHPYWETNSSEFTWHCSQQPCSLARRSSTDTLMCSRLSTLRIHWVNFRSLHSSFPSANSIIIMPRDQTSTLGPDLAPRLLRYTSGAIYFGCL